MLSLRKRQQIIKSHALYAKNGIGDYNTFMNELTGVIDYKCLFCKKAFINNGTCNTKVTTSPCLYHEEKTQSDQYQSIDHQQKVHTNKDPFDLDTYIEKVKGLAKEKGFITPSLLQHTYKISYSKASSIIDCLSNKQIIRWLPKEKTWQLNYSKV